MSYQFGSDRPKLDARLQGAGIFTAAANSVSNHYYAPPFDCLFNGLQIYAASAHLGDTISLEIQYRYGETWKRYKRFGKDWYIFDSHVTELILFPAWPKAGMRLCFSYENIGESAVNFAVNLFTFTDQVAVDTAAGAEGDDW